MTTLSEASLQALQARPVRTCPTCTRAVRPNYCRQHDEFFEAGHMSKECTDGDDLHDAHRTY